MTTPAETNGPLHGVRVVDMADGKGEMCGRFLADLGADVVRVEPPGGSSLRSAEPSVDGVGLAFFVRNSNKRSVVIDLDRPADRSRFLALLQRADVWIESTRPGHLAEIGLAPDSVQARFPHLVVLSIADFGQTGPNRDWVATDWTLYALGCVLSRSGIPGGPPLVPPGEMADEATSIQAAWVALLAHWNRLQTGVGDVLDFSRLEATAQILDPVFGSVGTAAAARSLATGIPRGRPESVLYPIFRCADGHVRIVVLAPRQWHGMRSWLGEPAEFADPRFDHVGRRFKAADRLYPLIEELFRHQTAMELVTEGQRRGVPIAPVLTLGDVLQAEHFRVRETFTPVQVTAGRAGVMPSGHILIDGVRAGIRSPAPALGAHDDDVDWDDRSAVGTVIGAEPIRRRPLEGLRVLDLGVIVMGGEAGRLLADQGADVVKVENLRFPDGARMMGMTPTFAVSHRNKRGLGLNLRDPQGVALFERLVSVADVVLTNFKPGTLDSLGIGYERLRAVNPAIVLVTSSAMGESGPWRDWMGYGPLVRCVAGVTSLWQAPQIDGGFGDSTTVYPDHFVARVVATSVLAALIRRRSTGLGAHIESSQAESIIVALGPQFLRESVEPGSVVPGSSGDTDAPWGLYPCAGDDEWCVVTVRDDADWHHLVEALGSPAWTQRPQLVGRAGRIANRVSIDAHLGEWTAARAPGDVARTLQAHGVPAGMMERVVDQLRDPQLLARGFFRRMSQPGVDSDVITENGPTRAQHLPEPQLRPAPLHGQHTRDVCREWLGMVDDEIDELLGRGVLEGTPPG